MTETTNNDDGRYQVHVDGIKDIRLIKPDNLQDIPAENLVKVCRIPCGGERGEPEVLLFPKSHSLFRDNNNRGNSPAMALCGLPLIVKQTTPRRRLQEPVDYDNQWATWLMIEPMSGLAPPKWQSYVGPVLVYRPNALDLSVDDMVVIHDFLYELMDCYGDGPDFEPQSELNPDSFHEHVSNFKDEMKGLTILDTLDRGVAAELASLVWRR